MLLVLHVKIKKFTVFLFEFWTYPLAYYLNNYLYFYEIWRQIDFFLRLSKAESKTLLNKIL